MKACFFLAALVFGILTASASPADEHEAAPLHAADGDARASPAADAGHPQTASPGASTSKAPAPPEAAGQPGGNGNERNGTEALKPNPAGTGRTPPDHGPRQSLAPIGDDTARPGNPIDPHITVNQGRILDGKQRGLVPTPADRPGKTSRTNSQKPILVPHPVFRPSGDHAPTRNAIGVTRPEVNAGGNRVGATPGASRFETNAKNAVAVPRASTVVPGVGPPGRGASRLGGASGFGASISGPQIGSPSATKGSASPAIINGTAIGHGAPRAGEIGGAAKTSGGINGSNMRPKHP